MPKISIIVPVYKVEKWLAGCVDSILAQSFTDWELILVDDGSPDKSGAICDGYAAKDKRIKVCHKENGGVSSARNFALKQVDSEYLTFVDADDRIDGDCLAVCVEEMEAGKADLLQFGHRRIDADGTVCGESIPDPALTDAETWVKTGSFNVSVWAGVYKTEIIAAHNIRFDESMKYAEDQLFVCEYLANAKTVKSIPRSLYSYFRNGDSATGKRQASCDLMHSVDMLDAFCSDNPDFRNKLQVQIHLFLKRIFVNHDTGASEYSALFDRCFDVGRNTLTSLKVYNTLHKLSPKMAYNIFGGLYSIVRKK